MKLPKMPQKQTRDKALTVRLSAKTVERLKRMALNHNMSQADIIELLIENAFKANSKK